MESFPFSLPESTSPHFDLFDAAYTGKLNRFKRLALNHAKGEGIGVMKAIGKVKDEDGIGCLHFAAAGGSLQVCKYLLENLKLDVDSKDGKGHTPLCHATIKGHLETVRYFLDMGANVDASNDLSYTPLHCAAEIGDTKIITLLLSRGVRVDLATRSGTALLCAARHGHRDAVKVLLDHGSNAGADPNAVSYGDTPLTLAASDGHVDDIKRLLEAGADPNHITNAGGTALEIAALYFNYQNVEVLFPVTSRIPTYPNWSIPGLPRDIESDANEMQREVHAKEKFHQAKLKGRGAFQEEQYLMAVHWFKEAFCIFPEDPAVLSNMSACFAHLGDGTNALDYATKCLHAKPEWPKAYYRLGAALNVQKRYEDAADAFNKGLTLDPSNKELKDAYMKAIEARMKSMKV